MSNKTLTTTILAHADRLIWAFAFSLSALMLTVTTGVAMAATAEPSYTILERNEDFELRLYAPKIIAQTQVTGDYDSASRQGFKILADYIFGNNTTVVTSADADDAAAKQASSDKTSSKISMTAPVIMAPSEAQLAPASVSAQVDNTGASTKISMTAPVSMQQANGKWQVSFVMPEHYTLQNIPKPNNPAITLIELPEQRYAVVKFSGLAREDKVAKHTQALEQWMRQKHLIPITAPELARYNPPWTLPFLRRNEVMIAYKTPK